MIQGNTDGTLASFTGVAKHMQGNTYYGVDSDTTAIYFDEFPGSQGTALAADLMLSVAGAADFVGVNGPSGEQWAVR
jgi:type IV pilus assembly protein PilA